MSAEPNPVHSPKIAGDQILPMISEKAVSNKRLVLKVHHKPITRGPGEDE
jgi:hypothetical protein